MRAILIVLLIFGSGCYRDGLYVQQEWVDKDFLASSHAGTPDPRQTNPPEGERLLIGWDFPRSLFQKGLHLQIDVRLWDGSEQNLTQSIERKRGSAVFFFSRLNGCKKPVLTYRVQAVDRGGEVVSNWEHHFWTEWINLDAASSSSDSVSSHPKQASVIDTP